MVRSDTEWPVFGFASVGAAAMSASDRIEEFGRGLGSEIQDDQTERVEEMETAFRRYRRLLHRYCGHQCDRLGIR